MIERSNAWMARFRRLARDCEWLAETFAGQHLLAFTCSFASPTSWLNVHNGLSEGVCEVMRPVGGGVP